MFVLNGVILPSNQGWTHPTTGVQYPANWLALASAEDLATLGIMVEPDPVLPDPLIENLKAERIEHIKRQANTGLTMTDWKLWRALERKFKNDLDAAGQELATKREAIRTASNEAEAAINAATTIAEVKTVPLLNLDELM